MRSFCVIPGGKMHPAKRLWLSFCWWRGHRLTLGADPYCTSCHPQRWHVETTFRRDIEEYRQRIRELLARAEEEAANERTEDG